MPEPQDTSSEVAAVISDIIRATADTISSVVAQLNQELTTYITTAGFVVSYSITQLINNTIGFYSYEWPIINAAIQDINDWLINLGNQEATKITNLLSNFDRITNILLSNFEQQLSAIDNTVTPYFNKRDFAIYGQIADFSKAINAPPSYLEENIQNARFFVMTIACLEGLSYYQFLADWNTGVANLLNRIANSVSLYQANPQRIKFDIEESLIKPIFDIEIIKRRQEASFLASLDNRFIMLNNSVSQLNLQFYDLNQFAHNLYSLTIEPALLEIESSFEAWKKDVYAGDRKSIASAYATVAIGIETVFAKIAAVLSLLDYGGDLLLRIDSLAEYLRTEQEEKIGDVSTRAFKRLVPDWLRTVKERIG